MAVAFCCQYDGFGDWDSLRLESAQDFVRFAHGCKVVKVVKVVGLGSSRVVELR